jgi:ATP-dependent DNA helicase RecQ
MEQIVYSGTKLNIKYWMKCLMTNNRGHDYFMESESDKIEGALKNLKVIMISMNALDAIKFISEVAN